MSLKEELQRLKTYLSEAEREFEEVSKEVDPIFAELGEIATIEKTEEPPLKETIPTPKIMMACKDCVTKHLAAASKIMKEAVTFARRGEKESAVSAVRDVMAELAGMERDIPASAPEGYQKVLLLEGALRKAIVKLGLEYVPEVMDSKYTEKLEKVSALTDELREFAYDVMKRT